MLRLPPAAESKGLQNEYYKRKKYIFRAFNKFEIIVIFLKSIINVRGGHCDYWRQTPKILATPLIITHVPVIVDTEKCM